MMRMRCSIDRSGLRQPAADDKPKAEEQLHGPCPLAVC